MTPQIITTLVIIVAMFALMLLNKFPLAVTMTLTGVALWLTGIVEPAKLYSNFGGSTIIFLIGMSIEVYALEVTGLVDMAASKIFRGKVVEKERVAVFVTCMFSGIITGFISNTALVVLMIPVLAGAAVKSCGKLHPKYLLMGVAVEATVGESISLIGGAPNLAAQGALEAAGVETMGFFSAAPLTLVLVVITAFYFATIGYNILVKYLLRPATSTILWSPALSTLLRRLLQLLCGSSLSLSAFLSVPSSASLSSLPITRSSPSSAASYSGSPAPFPLFPPSRMLTGTPCGT